MVDTYDEFIIESKVYQMVLEANMVYSDDFEYVMKEILQSDSPGRLIAREILNFKNKFVNINDNYIDITSSPTMLKFTPDNKLKKDDVIYKSTNNSSVLLPTSALAMSIGIDTSKCVYMSHFMLSNIPLKLISEHTVKTHPSIRIYLMQSAEDENIQIMVYGIPSLHPIIPVKNTTNKSMDVRVGRFVNKFLAAIGKQFTSKEIEEFVNKYQSVINFKNNVFNDFKIVEGEDIRYWYDMDNYENDRGQLGSSCMKYRTCQPYFDIYCENTNVCKMVIYTQNEKLIGRALLWTTTQGIKYMDRAYTNKDNHIILFDKWAEENGYKTYKNYADHLTVSVIAKKYVNYPYMDTFLYYYPEKGILSSEYKKNIDDIALELDNTNGYGSRI